MGVFVVGLEHVRAAKYAEVLPALVPEHEDDVVGEVACA
jgi:hypothetical protein